MSNQEIKRKAKFEKPEDIQAYRVDAKGNPNSQRAETLKDAALRAMYAIAALHSTDPEQFKIQMQTLTRKAQQEVNEMIASGVIQ